MSIAAAAELARDVGVEDDLVVGRVLAGDTAAFEALVTRYQGTFLRVARRMLRNHADAGDATQMTLVKAFARLGTYDRGRSFSSWIHRILRNECLNLIRARRPQEPLVADVPTGSDPLAEFEDAERQRRVRAALHALPRKHREAVVLRYFAECSYQEIGVALGIPEKTVKSRLFSARQHLARLLTTEPSDAHDGPAAHEWSLSSRRASRAHVHPCDPLRLPVSQSQATHAERGGPPVPARRPCDSHPRLCAAGPRCAGGGRGPCGTRPLPRHSCRSLGGRPASAKRAKPTR